MTNYAKHTRPANGTLPTSGWAPSYSFLLEANQRGFARWLNGVNALSQEIAQFTQSRLQDGSLVDARELQQSRDRLRMPTALRRKGDSGIYG
jgi:hypothetical protein